MSSPAVMYCNCMEEVKIRIAVVLSVVEKGFSVGREDFDAELVCVQLRKTLELIAFASLTANKERYAEAHDNFTTHWNAKRLLANLEKIHPDFYPKPVEVPHRDEKGVRNLSSKKEGFLTREEFTTLYDKCSEVLHSWNPFREGPRMINFGHSIHDWVARIQKLLAVHLMCLVGMEEVWVVYMQYPEDGKVHALIAKPAENEI